MMIWLTLLPFTLWTACRWAMLPITLLVAFLLLGEPRRPAGTCQQADAWVW